MKCWCDGDELECPVHGAPSAGCGMLLLVVGILTGAVLLVLTFA